jgi:TolB protein
MWATRTPEPPVVASTATPANAATAMMVAAKATLSALTVGTYTPVPPDARTPTPEPTATPLPLLIPVTPPATSTPTPTPPAQLPRQLANGILFFSDREGQARLYAVDPATGQTLWVTKDWPHQVAQALLGRSPDGKRVAYTQNDSDRVPQILVRDEAYSSVHQITNGPARHYDAVWSPRGDLIAFVSQEPGNDEIYTVRPDGSDMRRLTENSWEWDKHPSWSPDGRQIVFWSNRETGRRQLWVMDADGRNQRRLLDSPYNDWDPIWVK